MTDKPGSGLPETRDSTVFVHSQGSNDTQDVRTRDDILTRGADAEAFGFTPTNENNRILDSEFAIDGVQAVGVTQQHSDTSSFFQLIAGG